MASFSERLKAATQNSGIAMAAETSNMVSEPSIMTLEEIPYDGLAYSGEESWVEDRTNYRWFDDFEDGNYSVIDDNKTIILNDKQFNITQEENSQFISFEMSRRYDGYDLTKANISIHYDRSDGSHGSDQVVNVKYTSEKIRFAWLVNNSASALAGKLSFEIHATGAVSDNKGKTYGYEWKTRPNASLEVLQSLCGADCDGIINIDDSWVQELVTAVAEKVAEQIANAQIGSQVTEAQNAADRAEQAAINAEQTVQDALNGYATETFVKDEIAKVDVSGQLADYALKSEIPTKVSELENDNGYLTEHQSLEGYATENFVTQSIADADIEGKLGNYYKKTETYSKEEIISAIEASKEGLATETFVAEEIKKIDVSEQLAEYAKSADVYTKEETYSKDEINTVTGNQNSKINTIEAKVNSLGNLVSDVTESENGIEIHYNSGESKFVDTKDTTVKVEDVNKSEIGLSIVYTDGSTKEIEVSGGGGSSTVGSAIITRITPSSVQCRHGDECPIDFEFTATDSAGDVVGDGTATWYIGNVKKTTSTVVQGQNSFDISKYLNVGTNNVKVSVSIDTGGDIPLTVTKTWTINAINMYVVWNYDDTTVNTSDTITLRWTPWGNLQKTSHIVVYGDEYEDGKKEIAAISTTRSGVEQYYTIDRLPNGSHMFEIYLTATINEATIPSESVFHDLIFSDTENKDTIISSSFPYTEMTQYNTVRIPVVLYNPTSLTTSAILAVDGVQIDEWKDVDRSIHYWNYTPNDYGVKTLTITSGNTVKELKINVKQLQIDNEEIQGYAFRLKASEFAGNEALRSWNSNGVTISFSDNFDWNNGGIKNELDENGNTRQYICIKAGTTATIDYLLFGNDAKVNGKNFKVIFKATNSRDRDAKFLSCMNGGIGIELGANGGVASSGQNTLNVQYSEESYVEFEYDVSPAPTETSTDTYRYIQTYLDGVLTSTNIYAADDQFKQSEAQRIVIGSPDCDVNIYMIKTYESYLSRDNHIVNFIADAPNAQEMVARYDRNNILDDSGEISYEKLAQQNPNARVHLWSIPRMTEGKKDYVTGCSYQQIYKAGDERHQLTANNVTINIQGTSSVDYKDSGANTDSEFTEGFTDGNGNHIDTYSMSDNSIGVNYFNTKVNIASCENINNMCIAEWYNRYQPYKTLYRQKNPLARDCMEHNIGVQFIHDQSHTLFGDDNYHMYAICNMGNSKNNSEVFHDLENPKECCIETKDNNSTHCMMLDPNFNVDDLDSEDFFEFRYPKSPTDEMKNAFIDLVHWFANGNPVNATGNALESSVTFEPYTFRGTGQDDEVLAGLTIKDYAGTYTHDTYEYRMAKMLSECEDHLIMDSMVYHYVFIEQHAMVDNVCKNTFWGTEDLVHWHLSKNYDNDTADGNNNTGKLVIPFGSEGYDDLEGSPIFNGRDNVYWRFIYGLYEARRVMWTNRETAGAWNAEAYLAFARERQNYLPERVYNQDYWYKYLRLYEQKEVTTYIPMLEGGKKNHQREAFVTNNLYYMASQYMGTACISKSITLRGYTPSEWVGVEPKAQVTVMLYNKGYVVAQIGSIFKRVKADKGVFYTIDFPESGNMNDTVINIHGANLVQAVGDISCLYPGRSDYSAATKIKSIQIGSSIEGYQNNNLTEVGFGTNKMLEELYIQNCPNIKSTLDLSGCQALSKLDVRGSGFTGITFAVGGLLEEALLCSPSSLNMRSLYILTDEKFSLESHNNLTQIRLEDCSNIDSLELINNSNNLSVVRILGIDWTLEDTTILNRLLELDGLNENNISIDRSILSGKVYVPVIRQHELKEFKDTWSNLEISYDTLITQFPVTFVNEDGTILDIQYVDKGENAVDPITRAENPIGTPTKESTVSHNFTFAGWDSGFTGIFAERTITATYTSSLREYTVKYVSKGTVMQESKGLYGLNVIYTGDTPTYTLEESAYVYHLFNRWDKSGFIDGDKTINAIYDRCEYTEGYFDNRELADMSPVEIYAMTKVGNVNFVKSVIDDYDTCSFTLGHDYDFDDIDSELIVSEKISFNGTNQLDTGIQLFDVDKDFVLAIDYKFLTGTSSDSVLAQCFQSNGRNGFQLKNNGGASLVWGTTSKNIASIDSREMIVIRHKKGDTNLTIYSSNLSGMTVSTAEITGSKSFTTTSTLVFGCRKADDGAFEKHAVGEIHWAKLWFADLGEEACKTLALWTHEEITLQVCGFNKYYLTENDSKRCSFSLLASHLLDRKSPFNNSNTNVGGWATSALNTFLNTRLYDALPAQMKLLVKQVKVASAIGGKSSEVSYSDCYITVPAAKELNPSMTNEPYNSEIDDPISYMTSDTMRKRAYNGGDFDYYWTRSPHIEYDTYMHFVNPQGQLSSFQTTYTPMGILIQISI